MTIQDSSIIISKASSLGGINHTILPITITINQTQTSQYQSSTHGKESIANMTNKTELAISKIIYPGTLAFITIWQSTEGAETGENICNTKRTQHSWANGFQSKQTILYRAGNTIFTTQSWIKIHTFHRSRYAKTTTESRLKSQWEENEEVRKRDWWQYKWITENYISKGKQVRNLQLTEAQWNNNGHLALLKIQAA